MARPGQPNGGRRRPDQQRTFTGGKLPRWVRDEITRATSPARREAALRNLEKATAAYASERYAAAFEPLRKAKDLAPRSATVRELLGLSAYHTSRWDIALRELRAYRRMAGDTLHMAVEMDCLRALGRTDDVHKTWDTFLELGGSPAADAEARVVYGSFLLDEDDPKSAWEVTKPKRLTKDPSPWELRRWYVAARAAARLGDKKTARQLRDAIRDSDPEFVGLDELDAQVA
ncbi:MAG: tetratricopeptide repeat protein [Acidimicrobiia bacterium]